MSHIGNDEMVRWEEKNYDWILTKFMKDKDIADKWADLVYNEFVNSQVEPDYNPEDDR